MGEFKIWKKEDSDDNHNEAFTLGVPHNMVPGSEKATAFMIGKLAPGGLGGWTSYSLFPPSLHGHLNSKEIHW